MSAYLVSEEQIHVMVWAAARYSDFPSFMFPSTYGSRCISDHDSKNAIGQELINTNAQALEDLYGDITNVGTYTYQQPRHATWEPLELIKIVHNYEYQASDCDHWQESDARRFCEALVRQLLYRVPGFDQAHWGIEEDTQPSVF